MNKTQRQIGFLSIAPSEKVNAIPNLKEKLEKPIIEQIDLTAEGRLPQKINNNNKLST